MDCVLSFGKGTTGAGPMNAVNADKLSEYDNITLKGH
jgi:hypothetical protein